VTTLPLRLAIFDCDGTLVDSFPAIHEAMTAAFRDFGLSAPPADRLRAMIGLSVAEQVATLAPTADHDQRLALENGVSATPARPPKSARASLPRCATMPRSPRC
jgi:phosphoglycolate phosphatase